MTVSKYPQVYYEDLYLTESEKNDKEYLMANADHWIAVLVEPKTHIKTYRNYYNGVRDSSEFEYLTSNYGIGTPSALKFTNLIKPRVDALVSQLESDSYSYTASATDSKTVDIIQQERKIKKIQEAESVLKNFTEKMRASVENEQQLPTMSELEDAVNNIHKKYSTNFISDFEVAVQRVCDYFERSNSMMLRHKLALLVHDLIVTGECYYRVYYEREGQDPIFEVIKPENFFHNKSTNSPFIDTTDAVVHREYLTHKEVAQKYGKFMSPEEMKKLFGERYMSKTARTLNSGLDLKLYYSDEDPVLSQRHKSAAYTVEVCHVEWLATNEVEIDEEEQDYLTILTDGYNYKAKKKVRRTDRYECTRIGGTVYVNAGKSDNVPRSQQDPYHCTFSYGGVLNSDRNGKPYSIVGALKDLQDLYDLTMFYRDNLVANSGVPGDRINVAGIPKVLGKDFMSRLFKFIALKKNGLELIDPTEQGAELFQHYGSFDNSVNGQSLVAINALLQQIEMQAHMIAGTTPQMLGFIEERDAVTNVMTGIKQAYRTNGSLFELFRANQERLMSDLIKVAQVTYKHGRKVSYVVGDESYIFSIIPEKFCYSDYAISITYASKDEKKLDALRILAKELVSANAVDPDVLTKSILSNSITEVNRLITENWKKKQAENDQLAQASQAIEQYEKQIKELTAELNNIKQQLEAAKTANDDAKMYEVQQKAKEAKKKLELEERKLKDTKEYNEKQIELKKQVVQLEREQLYMGTGAQKEVKNL